MKTQFLIIIGLFFITSCGKLSTPLKKKEESTPSVNSLTIDQAKSQLSSNGLSYVYTLDQEFMKVELIQGYDRYQGFVHTDCVTTAMQAVCANVQETCNYNIPGCNSSTTQLYNTTRTFVNSCSLTKSSGATKAYDGICNGDIVQSY